MTEYIHKQDVPVFIDGEDFGIKCTLIRDDGRDYSGIPDWYGHIAFTEEQASFVVGLINSHNDESNPDDDYLIGHFSYDPETDTYTEYDDNEGTDIYATCKGFDVDGITLYSIGSDWCWTLEGGE